MSVFGMLVMDSITIYIMKKQTSIKQLRATGSVAISCPPEASAGIVRASTWWEAFCALPKQTRLEFPYQEGSGYELQETPGATRDLKEHFHFTEGKADWLADTAIQTGEVAVMQFVQNTVALLPLIRPLVLEFAREVEKFYGLEGFVDEVASGEGKWIIRFLHYFGGRIAGDEIATAHTDKSGFTLNFTSTSGLERLDYDGVWRPMPVAEGQTTINTSMQLQYRSKGELKALCHRVVATPATAVNGRFSMVCFIPLTKTASYNKKGAGRLQEFAPGFNYTMPFEEFGKLFVKE
ncbi:hypothetical protein EPO17_00555 [Patescibacteria group bacterium]|nr:MAG: hypothetical protein EPO17_00555 [Patescibacteria group bacterium]